MQVFVTGVVSPTWSFCNGVVSPWAEPPFFVRAERARERSEQPIHEQTEIFCDFFSLATTLTLLCLQTDIHEQTEIFGDFFSLATTLTLLCLQTDIHEQTEIFCDFFSLATTLTLLCLQTIKYRNCIFYSVS